MDDERKTALRSSLYIFGDLSGFLLNDATGHIVCGHQRRDVLDEVDFSRVRWGKPHNVELGHETDRFTSAERHGYVIGPGGARYYVRRVSWPLEFEQAANVAANSPRLHGEFTEDVIPLLDSIQAELPQLSIDVDLGGLLEDMEASFPTIATDESDADTPFADFKDVDGPSTDRYVSFVFGDYRGRVSRSVYDLFVTAYQEHQTDGVMLDDVLRGWLDV